MCTCGDKENLTIDRDKFKFFIQILEISFVDSDINVSSHMTQTTTIKIPSNVSMKMHNKIFLLLIETLTRLVEKNLFPGFP